MVDRKRPDFTASPPPRSEFTVADPGLQERLDAYEERAAIMQYDGGMTREEAEKAAWLDVFGVEKPNARR